MGVFAELVPIIHEQSEWKENASSFGALLELESLVLLVRGKDFNDLATIKALIIK